MSRRSKRRERRALKRQKPPENIKQIANLEELYKAVKQSTRLVSWKQSVQRFNINILFKIYALKTDLLKGKDIRKGFTHFYICERGKRREIQSLKFSERVIQKLVCSKILNPRFAGSFIKENSASQVGKGTLFASRTLEKHLREFLRKHKNGYILTIDFSKYFENIKHQPLIDFYNKNLTDEKVKKLVIRFITAYKKGLGLGSETSQFNAILYINKIDHFIKHNFKYYGRYMDDSYIISEDKEKLKNFSKILFKMYSDLGIVINLKKTKIIPLTQHFKFLKTRYKIVGNKIIKKPSRESITRARRRFRRMIRLYNNGKMTAEEIKRAFDSWRGSMLHRNARKSVYKIEKELNMLYAYNLENGEYSMTLPFETEVKEGLTTIAPPEVEENEVAVFDSDSQEWEIFNDYRFTHKMIKDGEICDIENYGEIPDGYQLITIAQAEALEEEIRINKLTMTPLDFIGVLQGFGLTLEQINAYLEANLEVKIQLTYCSDVYCGVAKSLMPITFEDVTITAEMVENAFKAKYGEI